MQGNEVKHIYFMGIGGIGMSGIAEILLDFGYRVSGSDIKVSNVTERLQKKGAEIYIGQRAENITADIDYAVRSTAIRETNEEYMRVKELGLPVLHRSQMLAKLMEEKKAICVAGAHGKTTTSSMISLAMELAGKDPTIVVGGEIAQIGSNAKSGNGNYLVAEADESDGSFLNLHPWMTVITNVEEDHLDHYQDLDAIRNAFIDFVKLPGDSGVAVLNYDCPETRQLAQYAAGKVVSYGMADDAQVRGALSPENGEMRDLLFHDRRQNKTFVVERQRAGVKEALLEYDTIERLVTARGEECSLVHVLLHTGRTHQIRVQFASRGHSLLGDGKYGGRGDSRQIALFATRLAFLHPVTRKRMEFEAAWDALGEILSQK